MATRPVVARSREGLVLGKDGSPLLDRGGRPVVGFSDDRMVFLDVRGKVVQGGTFAERRALAARERNPPVDRYLLLYKKDLLMP